MAKLNKDELEAALAGGIVMLKHGFSLDRVAEIFLEMSAGIPEYENFGIQEFKDLLERELEKSG